MLPSYTSRKTLPPEVIDQVAKQLCLRGDTETLVDLALTNSTNYKTAMRWLFYSIEISVGHIERLSNQINRYDTLGKRVQEVSVFYDPSEQTLPMISLLPNVTQAHIGVASFTVFWQMWHQWTHLEHLHIGDIDFSTSMSKVHLEPRPVRYLELSALPRLDRQSLHAILKACPLLEVLKIDVGNSTNAVYHFHPSQLFNEKDLHEAIWPKKNLKYLELYTSDGTCRLNMQTLCNGLGRTNITHLRVMSNTLLHNDDVGLPSSLQKLEIITYSWIYEPKGVRDFISNVCMLAPEIECLRIVMQHDTRSWSSGWTPTWTHPPTLEWADGGSQDELFGEHMWTVDATMYTLAVVRGDAHQGRTVPDVHIDVVKIYATDSPQTAAENLGGVYKRVTNEITLHGN